MKVPLYPALVQAIRRLEEVQISSERRIKLEQLADYVRDKSSLKRPVKLHFICTHKSRRSHLAQVWAQALSKFYGLNAVHCFSGGTEETRVYPSVLSVLEKEGFVIEKAQPGDNPHCAVRYSEGSNPVVCFSKTIDHPDNPSNDFAAIMTCSSADEACPVVNGCDLRIALNFEDPKAYDGTPEEFGRYLERSRQIAGELKYMFSQLS